ncbi:MAG: nucleotide exchange factor GrpE [Myxococcaceae bacterium]|nr:nucleotide exchange factor GrpE [Myxococcaceae bacterium]
MAEPHDEPAPSVKINDRRRFTPDGEPKADVSESPAQDTARVAELQAQVAQLEAQLASARGRVDELARAYQAQERDRDEFKARLQRERERMIDVEKGQVAQVLIEAVDQLDLCLAVPDGSPLAQGVKLIRDNLVRSLDGMGVQRLDLVGAPFDPQVAEAADAEVTPDPAADGQVLQVIRAGYQLKGKVVRPARVRVARYVKPAQA